MVGRAMEFRSTAPLQSKHHATLLVRAILLAVYRALVHRSDVKLGARPMADERLWSARPLPVVPRVAWPT